MIASRVQLEEIAESVSYGVTASACDEPVGPKFLRITDIQNGRVDWNEVPWCESKTKSFEATKLRRGDIVFARTGATTGKSFLITSCPENTVFASYLIRVRLGEAADPGYVSHFFQTADYWSQITKSARGVAQPGVNATTLKTLQIPLPPLAEQKRIAGILDAADALRATRRESLAQLDTLLQSTFLDMFGDPITNPMGWEELAVADLCENSDDVRCGPFGTQLHQHEFTKFGVPLWGIKHVNAGFAFPTDEFVANLKAASLAQYSIVPGDLVMTRKGTIGNCYIYPSSLEPGIMHSDLLRLRLSPVKADAQFICAQFSYSRHIQRQLELMSPGAVMPGINVTKLKKLKVEAPPLDLQQRFAAIVESVEQQKTCQRAHLAELDSLFASLQSRAFRGDL